MSIVDSLQNLIFKSKAPKVSTPTDQAMPPIQDLQNLVAQQQQVEEDEKVTGEEISVEDLKQVIRKQEIKIRELDKYLKEMDESEASLNEAMETVDEQEETVQAQLKEYRGYQKEVVDPTKQQELKRVIDEINKSSRSIVDARRKNEKSLRYVKQKRKELLEAKKIQETALKENRDALTQVLKAGKTMRIRAGEIEDIKKRALIELPEESPQVPIEATPEDATSVPFEPSPMEDEDDYWKMAGVRGNTVDS